MLHEEGNGVNCTNTDTLSENIGSNEWRKNNAGEQIAIKSEPSKIDSLITDVSKWQLTLPGFYPVLLEEYILPRVSLLLSEIRKPVATNTKPSDTKNVITFLKNSPEGSRGIKKLSEIISACKASGKQIIICSIPDSHVYDAKFSSNKINEEAVVKAIADYNHTEYFSGYRCFNFMKPEQAPQFFHTDGHWNTHGSKVFADSFSQFLK